MIRHYCDACGHETGGSQNSLNLPDLRLSITPAKQTTRHARTHTASRNVRVSIRFGLDGVNPAGDHPDHDLCGACRASLLREVADAIDTSNQP